MKTTTIARLLKARSRLAHRRGTVILLSVVIIVVVFAFASFTVDLGFLAITLGEMRTAADGGALAGATELVDGWGAGALVSSSEASTNARTASVAVAGQNPCGDRTSAFVDSTRDVRLGQYQWDSQSGSWQKLWGTAPYNMIEVTVRRDQAAVNGQVPADGEVPLFLGQVMGLSHAGLTTRAIAALAPGVGFRISESSTATAGVLPIAVDQESWDALMAGTGSDDYQYSAEADEVTSGSDGLLELNLYPSGSNSLPPGNRGTVDIGSNNNSTADLKRQIQYGVNASDLAYHGGELRFDEGTLSLNGDPGLSAGIESALQSIVGQSRAIPVFSEVSGPGNNAQYTIVRFVGVRILYVKLTGGPNNRKVVIQPAPYSDPTVIRGNTVLREDSIVTTPLLIE